MSQGLLLALSTSGGCTPASQFELNFCLDFWIVPIFVRGREGNTPNPLRPCRHKASSAPEGRAEPGACWARMGADKLQLERAQSRILVPQASLQNCAAADASAAEVNRLLLCAVRTLLGDGD